MHKYCEMTSFGGRALNPQRVLPRRSLPFLNNMRPSATRLESAGFVLPRPTAQALAHVSLVLPPLDGLRPVSKTHEKHVIHTPF